MVRLLNRAACRYLVRGRSTAPLVAAPGPEVRATTDWAITPVADTDSVQIANPKRPDQYLQIREGTAFFGEKTPGPSNSDIWQLIPAGDGGGYVHIVDAYFPGHGLLLGEPADRDGFGTKIGPIDNTPETMWLLDSSQCVRDARSIHLRYPSATSTNLFYNEVSPLDMPLGTYFCATGFGSDNRDRGPCGYAGIQRRPDGSQIAIFSVWHRMVDEVTPDRNALAVITAAAANAEQTAFAGEGVGQSIRIPLAWEDTPVRFAIVASSAGPDTALTAFVSKEANSWLSMGTVRRANTGGGLLTNLYAFVEDYMRNGNEEGVLADQRSPYQLRRAVFSNPWTGSGVERGGLEPIRSAQVTAYSPHPLENLGAKRRDPGSTTFDVVVTTGKGPGVYPSVLGTTITDSATPRRRPVLTEDIYPQ